MSKIYQTTIIKVCAIVSLGLFALSLTGCLSFWRPYPPTKPIDVVVELDDYYKDYTLELPEELYSEMSGFDFIAQQLFAEFITQATSINTAMFLGNEGLDADRAIQLLSEQSNASIDRYTISDNIDNILISVDNGGSKQAFCLYMQEVAVLGEEAQKISTSEQNTYIMSAVAGYMMSAGLPTSFLFPVQYATSRVDVDTTTYNKVEYTLNTTLDEFLEFYAEYSKGEFEYNADTHTAQYVVGKDSIGAKYYIDMQIDVQADDTLIVTCSMQ